MLSSLHLKNYRAFRDYQLNGLGRVNLLVGGNNQGKTSVLEAVELAASGFSYATLSAVLKRRGEVRIEDGRTEFGLRYLFTGGEVGHLRVGDFDIDLEPDGPGQKLMLWFGGEERPADIFQLEGDWVSDQDLQRFGPGEDTCRYVGPQGGTLLELAKQWDQISGNPEEDRVIDILRLIDPDIERITFTGTGGLRAAFVRKKGWKERIPLGTMGEGVRRLVAIALPMALCANGTLTIDEIDTGLHWSVLTDLWRMLLRASADLNIQVFATSHSLDCLRAIAWLQETDPELCTSLTVFRVSSSDTDAVRYEASGVAVAMDQVMEIRGFPSAGQT